MTGSIRFDRAADHYDRTRAISDEAMARTIGLLAGELVGRGPILEVGVGTGLLALPLHDTGVLPVGLDLTEAMLRRLVDKAGGRAPPFPLVLGDATRMPFGDHAFGGAYLRWVLHLIPDWRRALAEIVRVVRPGGVLLANLGAYDGERREVHERFAELAGISIRPVGLDWGAVDELDGAMRDRGATARELPPVREEGEYTIGGFLDEIRDNVFSWTWPLPDDVRLRAVERLRPWAKERFGALDEVRPFEHATIWRAYDLP